MDNSGDGTLAPGSGADCTAIPNVDEVACRSGSCQIRSCRRGFAIGQNGTVCETRRGSGAKAVADGFRGFSVQA